MQPLPITLSVFLPFSPQARTSDGSDGIWRDRRTQRGETHIKKAEVLGATRWEGYGPTDKRREAHARDESCGVNASPEVGWVECEWNFAQSTLLV